MNKGDNFQCRNSSYTKYVIVIIYVEGFEIKCVMMPTAVSQ